VVADRRVRVSADDRTVLGRELSLAAVADFLA
jgi:hypothetical protein